MNRNQSFVTAFRSVRALAFVALVLTAAIVTAIALGGRDGVKAGEPGQPGASAPPPAASPVATPKPTLPAVTPEPDNGDGGGDAMPIKVDLENATGADVYVDIVDETGSLVDATSGAPGDGMSVEPYTLLIENLDERTLQLTWVDFGIDNALALYVTANDGRLVLILVQPEPNGPTDSMGFDRVLVLEFDHAVNASEVLGSLQDGLDTPGL